MRLALIKIGVPKLQFLVHIKPKTNIKVLNNEQRLNKLSQISLKDLLKIPNKGDLQVFSLSLRVGTSPDRKNKVKLPKLPSRGSISRF